MLYFVSSLPPRTSMRLPLPRSMRRAVELLQPGVAVAFREPEEQPLYLDVLAIGEQRLKPARAQVAQALHQNIRLMEGLALRNLIEQFEDGAFRRRYGQGPFPVSPGLLREAAVLR